MSGTKRAASPPASSSKHARPDLSPPRPQSLHAWLHPETPPPLMTHSPPLHESTSTFLSFSISFVAPSHITTDAALTKEARRMVRELNVVGHVGEEIVEGEHGAFTEGAGKITNSKGKERAREPDHRMWAVRTLVLKDGRDGTKGEDDYQLLEASYDDGEKFGGERVLKIQREERAVDVLTICCRWYGGDMIGPIRFQHIGLTAKTSIQALSKLSTLRDLRLILEGLDADIEALRASINPPTTSAGASARDKAAQGGKYDEIQDTVKLERLIAAREKTKTALEARVGWATIDQARTEGATG
ncbi:hypothetical protein DB88DRAFT_487220 [Papiliotrema laurentii]|uniref:Impact N-terminal domain-containing protein n=1 Tax=Papiliotrema laurentii TaxID=5418 RepID=A0AAD9L5Y9_PAPLA|nr:hypothetical protein DB88DRAFT_487220 [Papiliotrema laurentii]